MSTTGLTFVHRALNWLRAGYPQGIPHQDYFPLLAVLQRSLTDAEIESIVGDLVEQAQTGHTITADDIRALIAEQKHEESSAEDRQRVTLRLLEGGWPLAGELRKEYGLVDAEPRSARPTEEADADEELIDEEPQPGSILGRIVAWLREGYPGGVPDQDYMPLLALLQRRLTKAEVKQVAKALRRAEISPAGPDDIATFITDLTNQPPSEADLRRVSERLAKKGWPVEFPDPL